MPPSTAILPNPMVSSIVTVNAFGSARARRAIRASLQPVREGLDVFGRQVQRLDRLVMLPQQGHQELSPASFDAGALVLRLIPHTRVLLVTVGLHRGDIGLTRLDLPFHACP